jgi:hypothetical protein
MRRTIGVNLTTDVRLGKALVVTGGVFAPGAGGKLDEECNVVLRAGQEELHVVARIVMVNEDGVGLEITNRTPEVREQIAMFARIAEHLATRHPSSEEARIPTARPGEIIERVRRVRYDGEESNSPRIASGSMPPKTAPVPAPPVVALARLKRPSVPLSHAPTQQADALEDKARAARRAAKRPDTEDE